MLGMYICSVCMLCIYVCYVCMYDFCIVIFFVYILCYGCLYLCIYVCIFECFLYILMFPLVLITPIASEEKLGTFFSAVLVLKLELALGTGIRSHDCGPLDLHKQMIKVGECSVVIHLTSSIIVNFDQFTK